MMRATSSRTACYIDRADGPHKWDVDGNRYVDFLAATARCCSATGILR